MNEDTGPKQVMSRFFFCLAVALLLTVEGCVNQRTGEQAEDATPPFTPADLFLEPTPSPTPSSPPVDLALTEEDISISPFPLQAGVPFTLTVTIHNRAAIPAHQVPVMVHIAGEPEQIGYTPFTQLLTVTVPALGSEVVAVPVDWIFAEGDHRLWVRVNLLPEAWRSGIPTLLENHRDDNSVLLPIKIMPFDASPSDLCPGRLDVEVRAADILPDFDQRRVWVRVHNLGNQPVYHLPIVVSGEQWAGLAYSPAIPPCGGTAQVYVEAGRALRQGELLTVQVNPPQWEDSLPEDNFTNNLITVAVELAAEAPPAMLSPPEQYDFSITADDIETPQPWIALVTVHNLGTRDAANVPIRIENQAGRKMTDVIPLVRGNGLGVAAIRIGYLWSRGGVLTFTVNPPEAKGAYPEIRRENNVVVFPLP